LRLEKRKNTHTRTQDQTTKLKKPRSGERDGGCKGKMGETGGGGEKNGLKGHKKREQIGSAARKKRARKPDPNNDTEEKKEHARKEEKHTGPQRNTSKKKVQTDHQGRLPNQNAGQAVTNQSEKQPEVGGRVRCQPARPQGEQRKRQTRGLKGGKSSVGASSHQSKGSPQVDGKKKQQANNGALLSKKNQKEDLKRRGKVLGGWL